MKFMRFCITLTFGVIFLLSSNELLARDNIHIVGSSTVFPFTAAVAETFAKSLKKQSPVVEATGTGGGFKLLCSGIGDNYPDISNASRAIKDSERLLCASNGITDIKEIPIGFDGIILAEAKPSLINNLTLKQVFMALAKQVPDENGDLIDNPYKKWNEIADNLPNRAIEIYGPPPTSGTRDAFVELAMEHGASTFSSLADIKKSDAKTFKAIAHAIREDGVFIEAGENDNLIVQKLSANTGSLGIFGYSFLENNYDTVNAVHINGVEPTFEDILEGNYIISRSLYIYIKGEHYNIVDGLKEFISEYLSEDTFGEDGYLVDKGLIPLPEDIREELREKFAN